MDAAISEAEFCELLPTICNQETSSDPEGRNSENPLWGHCAVAALVAQNVFGGKLLRASLEKTPFASMRSHYVNQLPDGTVRDFTEAQFGSRYPEGLELEERVRSYVLSNEKTAERYTLLAFHFAQAASNDNPLFDDPIYKTCFFEAISSGCQKMWFGAVIVRNGAVVCKSRNKPIEPLRHLCEPTCIRFSVQSRTESLIGACGHAEEFALSGATKLGVPLSECDLYVAGFHTTGLPWLRTRGEFTCLRCALRLYLDGIRAIYIPVENLWVKLDPQEELAKALSYALGEKKV